MTASSDLERELGPLEWILWLLRINVVQAARISGPLDAAGVRRALDTLQKRHPLLRSRIEVRGRGRVVFAPCDQPIALREIHTERDAWLKEAETELATPHGSEGPPVRCTILRHAGEEATLLFTYHHSIGDGRAGTYLMRELIAGAAGEPISSQPLPLRPPIEDEVLAGVSKAERWWRFARYTANQHWQWMRSGKPFGIVSPKDAGSSREARIAARVLDASLLERLSKRALAEQASVHSAFCAAQLLAIAARADRDRTWQLLLNPVSLGRHFDLEIADDFMLHAFTMDLFLEIDRKKGFWAVARAVLEQLVAKAARRELLVPNVMNSVPLFNMRRFIATDGPKYDAMVTRLRRSIPSSTFVSSVTLGDVPQDYGQSRLQWIAFFSANDFTAFTTVLTRIQDSACWSVTHSDAISADAMRAVMDDMQNLLIESTR